MATDEMDNVGHSPNRWSVPRGQEPLKDTTDGSCAKWIQRSQMFPVDLTAVLLTSLDRVRTRSGVSQTLQPVTPLKGSLGQMRLILARGASHLN